MPFAWHLQCIMHFNTWLTGFEANLQICTIVFQKGKALKIVLGLRFHSHACVQTHTHFFVKFCIQEVHSHCTWTISSWLGIPVKASDIWAVCCCYYSSWMEPEGLTAILNHNQRGYINNYNFFLYILTSLSGTYIWWLLSCTGWWAHQTVISDWMCCSVWLVWVLLLYNTQTHTISLC